MRYKKLKTGLILGLFGAGFIMLNLLNLSPITIFPPQPSPTETAKEEDAQVIANDETYASGPYVDVPSDKNDSDVASINRVNKKLPNYENSSEKKDPIVYIDNGYYPLRKYKALLSPNDPFASQWWTTNARMNQGWDIPSGSYQTTLAIIDTGFALKHEEFAGRWHQNIGESGSALSESPSKLNCVDRGMAISASCNLIDDDGDRIIDEETGAATYQNKSQLNCTDSGKVNITKDCNLIDDDGNGYIDDVSGWDFSNYDNSPQAGELNPTGSGTTHGSRVVGIAAATGNNSKGIAGVDWNTKIMPLQAMSDDSYGTTREVGRAINYAVEQGADVISLSLGSDLPDAFVREAIARATAAGVTIVAAAGNDGCDCIVYPANYPEVVAVGALSSDSSPALFSSFGANLDILAPGSGLASTDWDSNNGTSTYVNGINGTSYAAPMIAGVLTHLKSQQPNAVPLQLIAALTENTDRMGLPATSSRSNSVGYGRLNFEKASTRMHYSKNSQLLYVFDPLSTGGKNCDWRQI